VRKPKVKARAQKKKRAATPDPPELDDSEVELDSLGRLFMQLIDNNHSQEETETSHADAPEVTYISSDSENLPPEKVRRVIRKVPFSHPLAHLDPNFLLKKQQHNSRRQTRSAGSEDLVAGLSNSPAPRKRLAEVLF
jgi:hypothetical protein